MASKLAEFHKDDFIPYIPPAPLDEFCIFGLVYANEGKEDLLEAAYAECIRDAQGYEGIIHYCLTRDPKGLLKKGDTVTLWVEKNSEPSLQLSTDNKVWDIRYRGERLLDLACRNQKAGEEAERNRNLMALISGVSLSAFVYYQVQLSKKPLT